MTRGFYVTLTGTKNNAGDFLIKDRALNLLRNLRPDRDIVERDAWIPLSDADLELVNKSLGILLTGGPALRGQIFPGVYKLRDSLGEIEVPIVPFGIGWKASEVSQASLQNFKFTPSSMGLIKKMAHYPHLKSVRDYEAQQILTRSGVPCVRMTGCPALYSMEHIDSLQQTINFDSPRRVAFSPGVNFIESPEHFDCVKQTILEVRRLFDQASFAVAFHHALSEAGWKVYGRPGALLEGCLRLRDWCEEQNIEYQDISGSEQNLKSFYNQADLHIGYRVHAHIYMLSVGKPSLLVSEDSRGQSLERLLGGYQLNAYLSGSSKSLWSKFLRKKRAPLNSDLPQKVMHALAYEVDNRFIQSRIAHRSIQTYYEQMKDFVLSLP